VTRLLEQYPRPQAWRHVTHRRWGGARGTATLSK